MDNGSNHSNASPISAGTTFTKEEGVSVFTSLTESFMMDMVQRNAEMMATMLESQKEFREAQIAKDERTEAAQLAKEERNEAAQRAREKKDQEKEERNDRRFELMLQAFTNQSIGQRTQSPHRKHR
jgi:spore germination cell wall hydrolase CwlJ-like protein